MNGTVLFLFITQALRLPDPVEPAFGRQAHRRCGGEPEREEKPPSPVYQAFRDRQMEEGDQGTKAGDG